MRLEEIIDKWKALIGGRDIKELSADERSQFGKEYADALAEEIANVQPINITPQQFLEAGLVLEKLRYYRKNVLGIHCCSDGDCQHK